MPVFQLELDASGVKSGARDAASALDKTSESAGRAKKEISLVKSSASEARESMRGLALQVLAAVSAFKALERARAFLSIGFNFNAEWEQSRIGIASVLSATSDLVDENGRILKGAEAYSASLGVSEEAMRRIKIMGLETTATTGQLVEGFQALIGPANAVGMSMEQTMDFTLQMVQSLGALGIPLNQLSAEARSLLDGTIVPTQDRLATALGITGEMVKKWKEQGVLVQELNRRLSVFSVAGADVAQTWGGLSSNMKDAMEFLSGTTGEGFFTGVKAAYSQLLDFLVNVKDAQPGDDIKNITEAVRELQDFLGSFTQGAAQELIDWLKELNEPEKLNQLKEEFEQVGKSALGAAEMAFNVGGHISDVVSISLDGWKELPEIVQELGIIGAIAFGWRGKAALAGIGIAVAGIKEFKGWVERNIGEVEEVSAEQIARQAEYMEVYNRSANKGATKHTAEKNSQNSTVREEQQQARERTKIQSSSLAVMTAADQAFTKSAKENVEQRKRDVNAELDFAIAAQTKAKEAREKIATSQRVEAKTPEEREAVEKSLAADIAKYEKNIAILSSEQKKKIEGISQKTTSSADSARRALESINAEIAKLNGQSDAPEFQLTRKLEDIAKAGKEAKLSLDEVKSKQGEFATAFNNRQEIVKASAIEEAEINILKLTNGTSQLAIAQREAAQQARQLEEALRGKGVGEEEAADIARRTQAAVEQREQLKDAQLAANFMKELSGLSGDYGLSQQYVNEQLRIQADIFRSQLPESMQGYVDQWERLQKLENARDPFSGFERGMRKWSASATDTASQVEGALTSAFDGASDALANMVMTGKADFASLANSIIADMARMAAKQAMGGIVGGIGNIIGSALGGMFGSGASTVGSMNFMGPVGSRVLHAGGLVGIGGQPRTVDAALFAGAPRLHKGGYVGLGPDEVPIIGLRGERMLNRAESRAYEAGLRVTPMPVMPKQASAAPTIIIHNYAKGTEAKAEAQQQPDGSFKIDVIVEEVDRRMAQRVTNGKSHTARALDATRGMSPAPAAYRG